MDPQLQTLIDLQARDTRIAALEAQLGKPLFDRVGRQIGLTDAGRALLPHARRVLQEIEDGRRALSHLSDTVSGRLTLGTSHHIGLHRLPPVLSAYTRRYPDVDLDIHFMDSEDACEAVLAGKLEMGIVTLPTAPLPQLYATAGARFAFDEETLGGAVALIERTIAELEVQAA